MNVINESETGKIFGHSLTNRQLYQMEKENYANSMDNDGVNKKIDFDSIGKDSSSMTNTISDTENEKKQKCVKYGLQISPKSAFVKIDVNTEKF